jgi:stress response protein YsnF
MGTQALAKRAELIGLTRDEVRRLPKVHVGFEAFVEPLAEIAEDFADDMGRGGIDLASMREALANYQDLAAVQSELEERLALVIHTRQFNKAKVWSQELIIYNKARAAARTNREVAVAIEAFARFMKPKVKRKKRA